MPFVERDEQERIVRLHRDRADHEYEYLPHDSREVLAFLEESDPLLQRKKELTESDFQLIRGVEDLIQALLDKGIISEDDLPKPVKVLLKRRQSARDVMKDLMETFGSAE